MIGIDKENLSSSDFYIYLIIFINATGIRKALSLSDSPSHGLTFCQGTYTTMQEDVISLIHEFGHQQKIFFYWKHNWQKPAESWKTYEIHITATIQTTWHLYSQTQPSDAVVMPTEIKFKKNPLVILDGKVKEVGIMEAYHDKQLKISANQYAGKVDFVKLGEAPPVSGRTASRL